MTVDGDYAQYDLTENTDLAADAVSTAAITDAAATPPTNGWQVAFDGDDNGAGEFAISDTAMVKISALEGDTAEPNLVRFEETGANTGVFTNEDGEDDSNIAANGNENDDFTIEYADDSVQVFIEKFDSTLELNSRWHVGLWRNGPP